MTQVLLMKNMESNIERLTQQHSKDDNLQQSIIKIRDIMDEIQNLLEEIKYSPVEFHKAIEDKKSYVLRIKQRLNL